MQNAIFPADFSNLSRTVSEMRKLIGLVVMIAAIGSAGTSNAQSADIFSGSGFKSNSGANQKSDGSGTRSSPFGFYNGDRSPANDQASGFQFPKLELPKLKLPKLEMPKLFQAENFPNPIQLSDSSSNNLLGGIPKFDFSNRDPNQPNFFQRMNERTKELFGRTKENFNNLARNNPLNQSKSDAEKWGSVTRGLNGDIGGSGNRNQPPVQPQNLRSARSPQGSDSKTKF